MGRSGPSCHEVIRDFKGLSPRFGWGGHHQTIASTPVRPITVLLALCHRKFSETRVGKDGAIVVIRLSSRSPIVEQISKHGFECSRNELSIVAVEFRRSGYVLDAIKYAKRK